MMNKPMRIPLHKFFGRQAFTLIEVMISLFILVLIGTVTSKAVLDAAKLKEVLKNETEFASEFRTSITFIERDLDQVFNPRWFLSPDLKAMDPFGNNTNLTPTTPGQPVANPAVPKLTAAALNQYLKGTAFQVYEYWEPVYDSTGIRPSRFKGDEKSMSFIAASHIRIYQQKKESIYAKIKYELVKQPPNPNLSDEQNRNLSGLFQLIKHENTHAFELEESKEGAGENQYVILENIKKLTFSYYKVNVKDPVKNWDSDAVDTKGLFPESVEMAVDVLSLDGKEIDSKILFKLETPNNVLPKTY
jgi:prepilin-type N-terminal cleavage/methylation domain-containing protein